MTYTFVNMLEFVWLCSPLYRQVQALRRPQVALFRIGGRAAAVGVAEISAESDTLQLVLNVHWLANNGV